MAPVDADSREIGVELRLVSTQRLNYPHKERLSGPEAESGAMNPYTLLRWIERNGTLRNGSRVGQTGEDA